MHSITPKRLARIKRWIMTGQAYDEAVGGAPLVVTTGAELKMELENPTAEIIRSRANEVFGNADRARIWLQRPRPTFGDRSPEQIIASSDTEGMRQVLEALISIEFGTFS